MWNREKSSWWIVFAGLLLTAITGSTPAQQTAPSEPALIEQGKFTLHKFEQAIGEETYEIRRDGDALAV